MMWRPTLRRTLQERILFGIAARARGGALSPGLTTTQQRCVMALADDMGGIRPKLDEHSEKNRAGRTAVDAMHQLVDAIRDNVLLDAWAVDELLDMQPSNEHAKALLVALGIYELIPTDETEISILERGLGPV